MAGFTVSADQVEVVGEKHKADKTPQLVSVTSDTETLKDLHEAISRLENGQVRAAIRCAADAVNRMALEHGHHGWASY